MKKKAMVLVSAAAIIVSAASYAFDARRMVKQTHEGEFLVRGINTIEVSDKTAKDCVGDAGSVEDGRKTLEKLKNTHNVYVVFRVGAFTSAYFTAFLPKTHPAKLGDQVTAKLVSVTSSAPCPNHKDDRGEYVTIDKIVKKHEGGRVLYANGNFNPYVDKDGKITKGGGDKSGGGNSDSGFKSGFLD